jgi:hypothetical protein
MNFVKLFPFIQKAIVSTEQLFGAGNGTANKAAVVGLVQSGVSAFDLFEGAAVPPELVGELASPLIDGVVALFNKLGLFKHAEPAPTTPAA